MAPTNGYSFGDIVLVPFPFTDQSATKKEDQEALRKAISQIVG